MVMFLDMKTQRWLQAEDQVKVQLLTPIRQLNGLKEVQQLEPEQPLQ